MSELRPLARPGRGLGLLAALVGPEGAEDGLIVDAILLPCAPSDGALAVDSGEEGCDVFCGD